MAVFNGAFALAGSGFGVTTVSPKVPSFTRQWREAKQFDQLVRGESRCSHACPFQDKTKRAPVGALT